MKTNGIKTVVKMIVMDLDDTLLRSDKTISDYTVSVLNRCRARGIRTAYATARSKQTVSRFFERFAPDVFIGYGGAVSFVGEKVISRFAIPAEIGSKLIDRCLREPEIPYVHACNETVAHANSLDSPNSEIVHYECVDFSQLSDVSYLKISLISRNPDVVERIASEFPTLDLLRYTGEDLYRFADRRAVKWNAVKAVAGYFNIDTDTVAAFGDDVNDTEMIKNCGIGVAVGNAVEEVKAAAKYICDTNDNDGVAKWLEEYILAD